MTINIFVLNGDLNGKLVVVRFFFCRVYFDTVCNLDAGKKVFFMNCFSYASI